MIDQRSPTWFSTGVPVRAMSPVGPAGLARLPGLLGCPVLDVLGLIQDHCSPGETEAKQFPVPVHCAIAGDDQVVAGGLLPGTRLHPWCRFGPWWSSTAQGLE